MRPAEGRIPESLKAIFLASNLGNEVHVPPADNSASKVFSSTGQLANSNSNGSSSSSIEYNHQQPKLHQSQSQPQHAASKRLLPFVPPTTIFPLISPQKVFQRELKARGYHHTRTFCAKHTGYHNAPTEHQLASFGPIMSDIVKRNQINELRSVLEAGLSPNACNERGESLVHLVCRHDKVDLFRILVAFDVDIQQTDAYGRTVMQEACWASNPSFEIARCLIERDPGFLFMYDDRGMYPLSYVTKANWGIWEDFLLEGGCIEKVFPATHTVNNKDGFMPPLCRLTPNSRPVPDPKDKIDTTLANMVASGAITAYDAMIAVYADDESTVACSEAGTDYDDDEDDDTDFCDVSSSYDDSEHCDDTEGQECTESSRSLDTIHEDDD